MGSKIASVVSVRPEVVQDLAILATWYFITPMLMWMVERNIQIDIVCGVLDFPY